MKGVYREKSSEKIFKFIDFTVWTPVTQEIVR